MNILSKNKIGTGLDRVQLTLWLTISALLWILAALGAMSAADAVLTLAVMLAAALGFALCGGLRTSGYTFIPVTVLLASGSYVSVTLLSLGEFTWLSESSPLLHVYGLCWMLALYAGIFALTGRMLPSVLAGGAVSLLFGLWNYVTMQFRGRLLLPGDVSAFGTALSVADSYSLELSPTFVLGIALELLVCAAALRVCRRRMARPPARFRVLSRSCALALIAVYAVAVYGADLIENSGVAITWNDNDYEESPVLYFMDTLAELAPEKPRGYSARRVDEIGASVERGGASDDIKPHIIVVMSEAFSDLRQIAPFSTSKPVTPFVDSLRRNTIRGWVYTSAFGGGTANSEFEFLTGCSMAFVPEGVTPYQSYIQYDRDSLVSILEARGYTSVAMHPYEPSGWNREDVYARFGFDEVRFIDDFTYTRYLRNYVTDESNYENLIRRFEARDEGERLFLFNITMQNHGGYDFEGFEPTVTLKGSEGKHPEVEQYLSLLSLTDEATKELVEYFAAQEEPVVILFFGDHQPALTEEFYYSLYDRAEEELALSDAQRKQLTPFFIWTNYDIPERADVRTSVNYLYPMLLDAAGLEGSVFGDFLKSLQTRYPVVNALGRTDYKGAELPFIEDGVLPEALTDYQILQFNYLFDTERHRAALFGP